MIVSELYRALIYFIGFMAASQALSSVKRGRPTAWVLYRGLRARHFRVAIPTLVGAGTVFLLASALSPDILGWSYLEPLGGGTLIAGPVAQQQSSRDMQVLAWILPLVLLVAMPAIVRKEERMFRRGLHRASVVQQGMRHAAFGAMHGLVGVPVAGCLAIGLAGVSFGRAYRVAYARTASQGVATLESLRIHLAYNLAILGPLALLRLIAA